MDTANDPDIVFDSAGTCNHCANFDKAYDVLPKGIEKDRKREDVLALVKKAGEGKKYNCILGLSGGVDSSYLAILCKKHNLRPLVVHFDNGWNSELAVKNIEQLLHHCGFELQTYVVDWVEFRDLQLSYFKAGVVDLEIPTDHAIMATLYKLAAEYDIKYILSGHNVVTEGVKMPVSWRHSKLDSVNLIDIHSRFGSVKLKSYPYLPLYKKLYYFRTNSLEFVKLLDYEEYNKKAAKQLLIEQYGWKDYGGKHFESVFTRFYQSYILPEKFHIDKRRFHLSCLILSGQISKAEALEQLQLPIIDAQQLKEDTDYVLKKLGFSIEQFQTYMKAAAVPHNTYKTDQPLIDRFYKVLVFLSRIKKTILFWRK